MGGNMPITDAVRKKIMERLKNEGAVYIAIFGSYLRGEETPESDIDVLVRFSEPKGLLELVKIQRELSESIGKKVDLVTEGSLSPLIRDEIQREVLLE